MDSIAVASKDITITALQNISNVRHRIAVTLEQRKRLSAPLMIPTQVPASGNSGGQGASLKAPRPTKRPSGGVALKLPDGYQPL